MAKQDDYVRITLRLPPDLHQRLAAVTGAGSLNAEIINRLEATLTGVIIDAKEYEHLKIYQPDYLQEKIDSLVQESIDKQILESLKRLGVKSLFDYADINKETNRKTKKGHSDD